MLPTAHRHANGASPVLSLDAPVSSLDALDSTTLSALTPAQLASLIARLAALQSSIASAMFQHAIIPHNAKDTAPARWLDADEAAAILHKPRRWLFDNAKRYAWIKRVSRKSLLVDEAAMLRWIASRTR